MSSTKDCRPAILIRPLLFSAILVITLSILGMSLTAMPLLASDGNEESFQATWKLLNSEQKQQFIAGYLYGWRDAAKVTDVAIDYVESNPTKAVDSLKKIRGLYSMSDMSPAALSIAVDSFYTNPDNNRASLSQAISSARGGGVAAR